MLALIVEFRIHADRVDAFAQAIAQNAFNSLQREPGCRQFDICRDPSDPSLFFLYELYDDADAIEAHLRAEHFLALDSSTREWVASKTVRRMTRRSGLEPV